MPHIIEKNLTPNTRWPALPYYRQGLHAFDPLFLVPLGDKALLCKNGITQVEEMAWWDHITIKRSKECNRENTTIHFVPSRHWSARSINDQCHSLWGG